MEILDDGITITCNLETPITFEMKSSIFGYDQILPRVEKVIFNDPATIIIWDDSTKTVVKCMDGDYWDPEKGFAMAYLKKILGTTKYRKELKNWVKPQEKLEASLIANPDELISNIQSILRNAFAPKEDE